MKGDGSHVTCDIHGVTTRLTATNMSPKLILAEQELAEQSAARWFRYERAHEKHMQALQKDQNQSYEVLAQYEGYMPVAAADRIFCITQAEDIFLKHDNGASLYEWVLSNCIVADKDSNNHLSSHTAAANAALFLCSLELRDITEKGWDMFLETLRLKYQMECVFFSIYIMFS